MRKSKRLNPRRKVKYSKRKTKRTKVHHKRNRNKTRRYRMRGGNQEEIQVLRKKQWSLLTKIRKEVYDEAKPDITRDFKVIQRANADALKACGGLIPNTCGGKPCKPVIRPCRKGDGVKIYFTHMIGFIDNLVQQIKLQDPSFTKEQLYKITDLYLLFPKEINSKSGEINTTSEHIAFIDGNYWRDENILTRGYVDEELEDYLNKTLIEIKMSQHVAYDEMDRSPYFEHFGFHRNPLAYWQKAKTFVSPFGRNCFGRKITPGKEVLDYTELEYFYYFFQEKHTENVKSPDKWRSDPQQLQTVIGQIKHELDNYTF